MTKAMYGIVTVCARVSVSFCVCLFSANNFFTYFRLISPLLLSLLSCSFLFFSSTFTFHSMSKHSSGFRLNVLLICYSRNKSILSDSLYFVSVRLYAINSLHLSLSLSHTYLRSV